MSLRKYQIKLIILIGIIAASIPLIKEIIKNYRLKNEIANIQKQIENLKKENNKLKIEADNLMQDKLIELEAKSKLNLKKKDEEVIIISKEKTNTNTQPIINQSSNFKEKIIKYLKFWQ